MAMDSERVAYNPIMFGPSAPTAGVDGFGLGGGGLIGGLILGTLLRGGGLFGGAGVGAVAATEVAAGDIAAKVVALQNTSNIISEIGALGNEMEQSFNASNMNNANNFRALDNRLCESEKSAIIAANAALISGLQNTQSIKDQASAFQVINQENFCAVKELIHTDGDATRALITQNLIDDLRNQLLQERRIRDNRETEITINNSATAVQSQLQTQNQQQQMQFAQFANLVSDQLNKQTNSMINLGTMTGNAQTATAANTKVNS